MSHRGVERRIHSVYRTTRREYHVRAGVCVAVRDRANGIWHSNHEAVGMELEEERPTGVIGRSLLFLSPFSRLETSRVQDVNRPELFEVESYPFVWSVCPR